MSRVLGSLRRRGWRPSGKAARHDFAQHLASKVSSAPTAVDWLSFAPPIFNQGDIGSCYAHSRARAVTTAAKILGTPLPFVMSPDDHYRLTRAMMRASGELGPVTDPLTDSGSDPSMGSMALSVFGVRGMTRVRTPDGRFSDCADDTVNDEPDLSEVAADAHHIITGDFGITSTGSQRIADVCKALAVAPVTVGFFCDTGFENWKNGDPPYGAPVNPDDPEGGGHDVCCEGFFTNPDGSKTFIIANSWDIDWADFGRIRVSENFWHDRNVGDIYAELALKDVQS